jgi:hypothetical protein
MIFVTGQISTGYGKTAQFAHEPNLAQVTSCIESLEPHSRPVPRALAATDHNDALK